VVTREEGSLSWSLDEPRSDPSSTKPLGWARLVIDREKHAMVERFYCIMCDKRKNFCICVRLSLVGNFRPVDNALSSDSDRLLAVGSVTQSDQLVVELVQPPDTPAAILIKWPAKPTVTDPAKLTSTIAAIVRVLGTAQIELAARRAAGL
jgi:hypothetical protein